MDNTRKTSAAMVRTLVVAIVTLAFAFAHVVVANSAGGSAEEDQASTLSLAPEGFSLAAPFASTPSQPTPDEALRDANSRTSFMNLDRDAAVALAEDTFHVDRPSWTPPGQDDGGHLTKYLGDNSALETLPNGKRTVIASTLPLRAKNGSGLSPVAMTLRDAGESYIPANPVVPVAIAKQASGGVAFASGVRLAPVAAGSKAPPAVTGNNVVFANVAQDADLLIEPVPAGAEISWQLRSQQSPEDNALDVTLPPGASLRPSTSIPGAAEVAEDGKTLVMMPPPVALGADGRSVPASYRIEGNVLTTHVDLSGEVAFPVMVDPLVVGTYGIANGANVWTGWSRVDTCGLCFEKQEYFNLLQLGHNPGLPQGSWGRLEIYAPNAGQVGGAGITRVDLSGVAHQGLNQSYIEAGIEQSGGSNPVYSFNGSGGASGPSPLHSGAVLANQPIAFCAQGAGGYDGGAQPLCDMNQAGQKFILSDIFGPEAQTVFNYVGMTGATITYTDTISPNVVTFESPSGKPSVWLKEGPTTDYIYAGDQGLGIQRFELQLPPGNPPTFTQNISCNQPNGFVGCPFSEKSQNIDLHTLATGVYEVGAVAVDAAGNGRLLTPYPKLYVDHTLPKAALLTGPLAEAANTIIGNGNYALHFSAEDGSTASPQSGMRTFEVRVDGRLSYTASTTCSAPTGVPTSGCFSLSGDWTMNGQSFGAGAHIVSVIATDWAGNSTTQSLNVTVNEAADQPLGPGSVNLETGDYKLSATDVSMAAANATLSLTRSYDSRATTQGVGGPLGPQWVLSVPNGATMGWQSLTPLPEGSISVYTASGQQLIFSPKAGGGWESPAGYQTDTLTEPSTSPAVYQITDASGNYTKFTQPSAESSFVPSTVAQAADAGGLNKVTYTFTTTASSITEPTKIIAPEPTAGACTTTLVKGCRALTFKYASSTTATGENRSEWGDYKDRLSLVYMNAWDQSQSKMIETAVEQYAYDKQGRLRAEWDPRVSPALKTAYGYDAEGHVTALTSAGQQTWAMHYGAIEADPNEGRLLSLMQPTALTPLWNGEVPKNTAVPTLSGSAVVGVKMSTTNGTWAASPLAYSYQWQDCNGSSCTPILGATNPRYTVRSADIGFSLAVQVTAVNGGGSVVAKSANSAVVKTGTGTEGATPPAPEARWTVEYRLPLSGTGLPDLTSGKVAAWGQSDVPTEATGIFPPDEPQSWPATDYKRASLYYLDKQNRTVNTVAPSGGIATTEYDSKNNVIRTLSPNNRATAVAAGSKSVETSQALDTQFSYSEDKTELLSTLGPQRTIKLASGSEVLARKHTVNSYDEGAPSGGPYRLITKTTEGAQIAGQEDKDVRTVKTSYSGQGGLGWKLRAPTSSTADPSNLALLHKTVYDSTTGSVLEDSTPAANSETVYPPAFASAFGSEGTGNGQFKGPQGTATDASGNVWVADKNNSRIEKFSSSGTFIAAYGTKGAGNGQFNAPLGIAINQSTGNVFVADTGNNRIEIFNSSGTFLSTLGSTALNEPVGLAIDAEGSLWVTDRGHNRLAVFQAGFLSREVGSFGTGNGQFNGPSGIAISEGSVYVVDSGNNRVEQFNGVGAYVGQFGSKGSTSSKFESPQGIAANPSTGNLYVADTYNYRVQEFSPAGRFLTEWGTWGPTHALSYPTGIAIASSGKLYVSDQFGNQVSSWTPPEAGAAHLTYASQFGSSGSGNGQFSAPIASAIDGQGYIWVTDYSNNRVQKFSPKGSFIASYGSAGSGNGQFFGPGGIDINQSTGDVYISDSGNHRIEQLSSTGTFIRAFGTSGSGELIRPGGLKIDSTGNVWVPDMTANRIVKFSSTGTFIASYGKEGSGEVQFKQPSAIAFSGENLYVSDTGNRRVQELSKTGTFIRNIGGIEGEGSGELYAPEGIAADSAGSLYVVDNGASHVEQFSSTGVYRATFATKGSGDGQLKAPIGDSIDAAGNMYVVDSENNRVEKWTAVNQAAHTTKTVYYSSGSNSQYPSCGGHAEWAGLPCQAQPAQQPQSNGLPNLPVTSYTYNVWDEPLTTTDTVGSTTRTTTIGYDGAGRRTTSAISSTVGTALPTVTNKYSETTGALIEQTASTKTLKSKFNSLGQLETYTDADGNESTYTYDIDGRTEKTTDGKGTQTYTYDNTSGLLASLKDSAAGTFSASYDADANVTGEGYPNGMNATRTYDSTGQATGLEYVKTTNCSSGCTWFSEHAIPSVHGQWLAQTSSLAVNNFSYDGVGRLTEVRETPSGKGCTARLYAFDEDANRTSLTTRAPDAEGKCTSTGGTIERHTYDEGDRLTDEGTSYDAFGNTLTLPSSDAGGSELTSGYYANNVLASQKQAGQTISYGLDPARRTRESISTGPTNGTLVSHYSRAGDAPAWTVDNTGQWTRYIGGLGGMAAIQTNGAVPILQLEDLRGSIVATAAKSETETKLLSTTNPTEYGVPTVASPPHYSWLGGLQRPTELPTGVISMGARGYIPQLGRFEQIDPQPGSSANTYGYTSADPVNSSDPSGEWTSTVAYNYEAAQTGPAHEGLSEAFIVPGAVMPPPVDMQIEEEFAAHPPWSAASAEPQVEWLGVFGSGAVSASIFSKGLAWVKRNAKRILAATVGAAATVVIAGVTLVSTIGCVGSQVEFGDEAECWKVAVFGVGFTVAAAGTTVKAWVSLKENRPGR